MLSVILVYTKMTQVICKGYVEITLFTAHFYLTLKTKAYKEKTTKLGRSVIFFMDLGFDKNTFLRFNHDLPRA